MRTGDAGDARSAARRVRRPAPRLAPARPAGHASRWTASTRPRRGADQRPRPPQRRRTSSCASCGRPTSGNPFFIEEMLRDGELSAGARGAAARLPAAVTEAIQGRLRRLHPDTVTLLTRAAVCGREFRLDVLGEALGAPASRLVGPLEDAMARGPRARAGDRPLHVPPRAGARDAVRRHRLQEHARAAASRGRRGARAARRRRRPRLRARAALLRRPPRRRRRAGGALRRGGGAGGGERRRLRGGGGPRDAACARRSPCSGRRGWRTASACSTRSATASGRSAITGPRRRRSCTWPRSPAVTATPSSWPTPRSASAGAGTTPSTSTRRSSGCSRRRSRRFRPGTGRCASSCWRGSPRRAGRPTTRARPRSTATRSTWPSASATTTRSSTPWPAAMPRCCRMPTRPSGSRSASGGWRWRARAATASRSPWR